MFNISRQILTPKNLRKISKYCSISKSKRSDILKNSKKFNKTKQSKDKLSHLSAANVVMEGLNNSSKNTMNTMNTKNSSTNANIIIPLTSYDDYRRWEATAGGIIYYQNSKKEQGIEFTLASYNILAQDLLENHIYIYQQHKDKYALEWPYRINKLIDELLTLKPKIICLQEVQNDHVNIIKKELKSLNCKYIYKKKTGLRTDGCAIFYNADMFELKGVKSIEYFQPNVERLDRENVGLVAKLCTKNDPENIFLVATTHLLYNPRRQDVRLAQIQVLLAELDHLSFKGFYKESIPERYPIILTGDFNLKPYSAPYKLLTSGELEYSKLTRLTLKKPYDNNPGNLVGNQFLPPHLGITDNCQHIDVIAHNYTKPSRLHHSDNIAKEVEQNSSDLVKSSPQLFSSGYLRHGLNLKSAYHHSNKSDEPFASTYQNGWVTVDYIFYSKQYNYDLGTFKDSNLKLLSRYILPTVNECSKMGMIPNRKLGSDHLSLAVSFFLRKETNS